MPIKALACTARPCTWAGLYEVNKDAGGAMRVNGTLYYMLKDHLGSASVVTDASGNIVGEQRYYPFGETRLATGTLYTDKLYTGQRNIAGLGIYHYQSRFYSPKLGRFLSADSIVPNPFNPQDYNRYSYVRNNPVRYTDPSGHRACITQEECADMGTTPNGGTPSRPRPQLCTRNCGGADKPKGNGGGGDPVVLISSGVQIGDPTTDVGDYITGYNGGSGGLSQDGISLVGGDGECVGSVCSFSGGSVPIRYSARFDILLYDDLLVVVVHERYWMPGRTPPLLDNRTFGYSTLVSPLSNGQQVPTVLGGFLPGNLAYPDNPILRDTQINYWGDENFPTQLVIRVSFGAENIGAQTFYYQLPYTPP